MCYFFYTFTIFFLFCTPFDCGANSRVKEWNQTTEPPKNYEFTVRTEHPRLMIEPNRLPEIRKWIEKTNTKFNPLYVQLLARKHYAFLYALGHTKATEEALQKAGISSFEKIGRLASGQLLQDIHKLLLILYQ